MSLPDESYPSDRDIAAAVLDAVKRAPAVIADPSLPHQIVLNVTTTGGHIAMSCNCQATSYGYKPIEVRRVWHVGEAVNAYKQWHKERGIEL